MILVALFRTFTHSTRSCWSLACRKYFLIPAFITVKNHYEKLTTLKFKSKFNIIMKRFDFRWKFHLKYLSALLHFFLESHLKTHKSTWLLYSKKPSNLSSPLKWHHTDFEKLFLWHRNEVLNFIKIFYSSISSFSISPRNKFYTWGLLQFLLLILCPESVILCDNIMNMTMVTNLLFKKFSNCCKN